MSIVARAQPASSGFLARIATKISLFFFLPLSCWATLLQPWFGYDLLIELRPEYQYRYYPHIDINGDTFSFHSHDHFAKLSTSFAIFNTYSIECEINTFATNRTGYSFEDWKLTGRYLMMNDVAGDPVSLSAGISISQVTSPALKDLSCFHHGQMEYEAHLALGKEWICAQFWTSRIWGYISTGFANRGSLWSQAKIAYDINYWDINQFGFFFHGLLGFGSHDLIPVRFHGYGPIQHRSIDLGAYFTHIFPGFSEVTFEYVFRPWAFNFPTHAQTFIIRLMIPFNL